MTSSPIPTEGGKSWTWELHELSEGPSAIVYDEHGRMIADHLTPAIAAKIAAAPAMLEALQGLTHGLPELLESIGYTDEEGLIDEALAVIALAAGGEDGR